MTLNLMFSLDLRPVQERQIKGMIATLTIVYESFHSAGTLEAKIWKVLVELKKAILPDATFDTIIATKYHLNDVIGYTRLEGWDDYADCLQFVADTLQIVFDHYENLADFRRL